MGLHHCHGGCNALIPSSRDYCDHCDDQRSVEVCASEVCKRNVPEKGDFCDSCMREAREKRKTGTHGGSRDKNKGQSVEDRAKKRRAKSKASQDQRDKMRGSGNSSSAGGGSDKHSNPEKAAKRARKLAQKRKGRKGGQGSKKGK